jgi:predicted alpha/beta-hydrolase family hydrolase
MAGEPMKPTKAVKAMLLFPGAGTDRNHSSLVRLADALAPLPVARADFEYRKNGRRAPDRTPVLVNTVRAEASALAAERKVKTNKLVLGGRSMGGRMCSIAAAGGTYGGDDIGPAVPVAGLVLMCYPLHPPGKPDALRTEHFPRLTMPCLFISGTRDPFGTPEELEQWTATIPGPVTHVWAENKGHDLKGADPLIAEAVAEWLQALG